MTVLAQIPGRPRRGELDAVLLPEARSLLREVYLGLRDLQRRAEKIDGGFLSALIEAASDEARDQLRDDLIMREGEQSAEAIDAAIESGR
jgi:hypothetical protein